MKNIKFVYALAIVLIAACSTQETKESTRSNFHHNSSFSFINVDTSKFTVRQVVYVPLYSSVYMNNQSHTTLLTTTLSIRSTSFTDSIFVSRIDYYNTEGKLVKKYIDKVVLVKPMQTVHFSVEDDVSGMGANFIIESGASKHVTSPLVQAVMIGTHYQLGISFITNGVVIEEKGK